MNLASKKSLQKEKETPAIKEAKALQAYFEVIGNNAFGKL